jgi:hypothetical protein
MPVNIQLSKISIASAINASQICSDFHLLLTYRRAHSKDARRLCRVSPAFMVGLGGLEPPTSSLSGMRSSHLSYRPRCPTPGGAGRDRTGDLLNANQALSQLSYSPKRNQSRPVGCRDQRDQLVATSEEPSIPSGDAEASSPAPPKRR